MNKTKSISETKTNGSFGLIGLAFFFTFIMPVIPFLTLIVSGCFISYNNPIGYESRPISGTIATICFVYLLIWLVTVIGIGNSKK
jgi:hypothetical protein